MYKLINILAMEMLLEVASLRNSLSQSISKYMFVCNLHKVFIPGLQKSF